MFSIWKLGTKNLLKLAFLFKRIASVRKFKKLATKFVISQGKLSELGGQTTHESTQLRISHPFFSKCVTQVNMAFNSETPQWTDYLIDKNF